MSQVEVDKKTYQMPPKEGFTVAHFLTGLPPDREHVAHRQSRRRPDARQTDGNAPRPARPR
jgi:hypothetical protein